MKVVFICCVHMFICSRLADVHARVCARTSERESEWVSVSARKRGRGAGWKIHNRADLLLHVTLTEHGGLGRGVWGGGEGGTGGGAALDSHGKLEVKRLLTFCPQHSFFVQRYAISRHPGSCIPTSGQSRNAWYRRALLERGPVKRLQ